MSLKFFLGELFSGPGGMALGAKLAAEDFSKETSCELRINHVWGVDMDPNARNTYDFNLPGEGVCIDANKFVNDDKDSPKTISDFEKINALAFGFPCNDFSLVGEQKGFQGKFGNLYKAGIKAIEHSNPLFFVAENVSGIHSANSDAAFYKILKDLESAGQGYNLTTHLYKFEKYGVPQSRHRYIIVGIRKDQNLTFKVPSPAPYENCDVSASKALNNISPELANSKVTSQSEQVVWRLIFTPPGQNAWKLDEIIHWKDNDLLNYLESEIPWFEEKIKPIGTVKDIRNKIEWCRLHVKTGSKMSHIYKRLVAEKPSYTITGSGGGGTHVYHWSEPRALTNRERARLQTFPDDFVFKGPKEQVRKQIGMAVPPEGAKIIFKSILNTFAGIEYPHLENPSYSPMDDQEFIKYRYKRFSDKLKLRLRKDNILENEAFIKLNEKISEWISTDTSVEKAEQEIRNKELLELIPKS